jgi:hypothetical protein
MTGPNVVFLGPSLPHDEARRILPDVVCLPPAGMGDVLSAVLEFQPHAIGLVDGTFLSNMSVFHKELLFAMDQGTWVLGASSMGALRAAECSEYGMIGVGTIFEDLASGRLEDDDEVALTHADVDADFRPLSDALVTIRAAISAAQVGGMLSLDEADYLVQCQKERWFPDRRLSGVAADAVAMGMSAERVMVLSTFVRNQVVDPKQQDAIALLERIKQLPKVAIPVENRPDTYNSGVFAATLARDVVVTTGDGLSVTFDRIRRHAALHDAQFNSDMGDIQREVASAKLSEWLGGEATEDELAFTRQRICAQLGVLEDELDAWGASVDLAPADVGRVVRREALLLRLESSWLAKARFGESTTPYLDRMRLQGRYGLLKNSAALQQDLAKGVTFDPEPSIQRLFSTMAALGTWRIPADIPQYLRDNDLGAFLELHNSISVSVKAHQVLFGMGWVDEIDVPVEIEESEPMMTRGR